MDWLSLAQEKGLRFRKELGQHLLFDEKILAEIARIAVPAPGTPVLEIGAGAGALTLALQNAGGVGIAVEVDPVMGGVAKEVLQSQVPSSKFQVERPAVGGIELRIQDLFGPSDAGLPHIESGLEADLVRLTGQSGGPLTAVGNLPYRHYRDMILALLRSRVPLARMVWVVQAEAADRMRAEPGSRLYDPFPILLRTAGEVRKVREIPASAFHPRPQVRSSLVVWTARGLEAWRAAGTGELEPVLERLFRQRRKTLGAVFKSEGRSVGASERGRHPQTLRPSDAPTSVSPEAAVARICGPGVLGERLEGLSPEEAVRVARAATKT